MFPLLHLQRRLRPFLVLVSPLYERHELYENGNSGVGLLQVLSQFILHICLGNPTDPMPMLHVWWAVWFYLWPMQF
jgi:hypothetical protein